MIYKPVGTIRIISHVQLIPSFTNRLFVKPYGSAYALVPSDLLSCTHKDHIRKSINISWQFLMFCEP